MVLKFVKQKTKAFSTKGQACVFLINLKFSSAGKAYLINQNPSAKILGNSMTRAVYDKCFRAILGADY